MAAASANGKFLIRCARLAGAAALASLCGCGAVSDPAGFSIATQDRYDFMTCPEIIGARNSNRARLKQLTDLIEKAESSPGGFLVSAGAYRSEMVQARALTAAAERAAQKNNCDAPKKQ
jgi:hypothetical protein